MSKSMLVDSSTGTAEEYEEYCYKCPKCGWFGVDEYDNYCYNCGKKLRWENNLEEKRELEEEKRDKIEREEIEKEIERDKIERKKKEKLEKEIDDNAPKEQVINISFTNLTNRYKEEEKNAKVP